MEFIKRFFFLLKRRVRARARSLSAFHGTLEINTSGIGKRHSRGNYFGIYSRIRRDFERPDGSEAAPLRGNVSAVVYHFSPPLFSSVICYLACVCVCKILSTEKND